MTCKCTAPHPGSDEAIAQGCQCPRIDNGYGRGYMGLDGHQKLSGGRENGWVIAEPCKMHWREPDA